MTTSALLPLANASVVFEVAGVGVVTDPETGNVSPQIATVSYRAFLKAANVDPLVLPGVNADGVVYEGYVVEPVVLDPRVGVGSTGMLEFGTASPVRFEVLKARMGYADTGVLGERLTASLGTKITLLGSEA